MTSGTSHTARVLLPPAKIGGFSQHQGHTGTRQSAAAMAPSPRCPCEQTKYRQAAGVELVPGCICLRDNCMQPREMAKDAFTIELVRSSAVWLLPFTLL